jgi:hypothetical protein
VGAPLTVCCAQTELSSLNQRVVEHEEALAEDVYREEYSMLEKQFALLQKEQQQLEMDARSGSRDPEEARSRLLAKAKADNARMSELKAFGEDILSEIERQKQLRDELDADMSARASGGQDASKYDELYRRDEEMTEFIDRYPAQREKEMSEQAVSCVLRPSAAAATGSSSERFAEGQEDD